MGVEGGWGGLKIWESPFFFLDCWRVQRLRAVPKAQRIHILTASTMLLHFLLFLGALVSQADCYFSEEKYPEESKMQPPTVVVAIIARNTAHSLPYYLGALERLNYPKDRISVWWVSCMLCRAVCRGGGLLFFLSDYSSRSKGQWHLNEFVKAAASYPSPVPSVPFTAWAAFHSATSISYRGFAWHLMLWRVGSNWCAFLCSDSNKICLTLMIKTHKLEVSSKEKGF